MSFNTIQVNNSDTGYVHSIFDVSEYNAGATYADLSAAIAAIPQDKQKTGMSIRFIYADENNRQKYVQYRYCAVSVTGTPNPFTNTFNWQTEDIEPTIGSTNLVSSGGAYESCRKLQERLDGRTLLVPEPEDIIDNSFMTLDNENYIRSNTGWQIWKFKLEPNRIYRYTGKIGSNTQIFFVILRDANQTRVNALDYNTSPITIDHTFNTGPLGGSANQSAVYAYLNVSKTFITAFNFWVYNIEDKDTYNYFSTKTWGFGLDYYRMNTFAKNNSSNNLLTAITGIHCFRYKVRPNGIYKFSNRSEASDNVNHCFVVWGDYNGDFLAYSAYSASLTEDTTYIDQEVIAPAGAYYAYFNVRGKYLEFCKFEVVNLAEQNTLKAKKVPMAKPTGDDVIDGVFYINDVIYENPGCEVLKYHIEDLNRAYYLTSHYSNWSTGVPFAEYFDSEGNFISRVGVEGISLEYVYIKDYILIPPANTAYVYVNVSKNYEDDVKFGYYGYMSTVDISNILTQYGECKLGPGLFYVKELRMPPGTKLSGCGSETILCNYGDSTDTSYILKLTSHNKVSDIRFMGKVQDIEVTAPQDLDTISIGNRHGILFNGTGNPSYVECNQIDRCEFKNFVGGAITCDNTGWAVANGMLVSNCHIKNCGAGINIAYLSEFNRFTNVKVDGCMYGAIINGGNNNFVNCDFSNDGIGVYLNGGTNKALRYNGTTTTVSNAAHGLMSGCTINHSGFNGNVDPGYAIVYLNTNGGFLFTGIQLHYGKMRFINSESIQMCNVKLGFAVTLEAKSSSMLFISNVTYNWSSTDPSKQFKALVCTDDALTTRDTNYLSDGNLAKVKLLNSFRYDGQAVTISSVNHD